VALIESARPTDQWCSSTIDLVNCCVTIFPWRPRPIDGSEERRNVFFPPCLAPLITRFKPFKDETRECSRRNYEINSVFTLGGYYYNGTSKQMKWRMLIWNITFGFYDLKKDERSGGLPTWRNELARPKRLRRYVASRE
jgi:hypothetical protein